ncbi:PocR ligand-binding domain-containing protein [Paraclostridium sordellii]|uniref:PocR ligand-binding domain-containing protein n=1 Tax=Paraclostridium sordellii TaxID=1505 RepID=UPI0005DEFFE4|nr:PocR ligand-binding domain-containing protein [Paeniclostridium sordellii]CEO13183.1 AraC family transcriptional regulator [[Clostridium] sordellii] [Paeniclostridium sordellii]CEP89151.1 AraC family transcriptional regulator [[Clostridium] sordellii] [Paeniclostridium sordellii]CEP97838.1 AraC family transcriptional regulator [[Clostridium] sordellii] [Paeniclostridium sordellii]CEQ01227.1 AraC family transcriptional regulator [[Clostridium] sordellii] [Paeniclostridium sordellii]
MRNENLSLNKIIDFSKWDNLQDYLSLVTNMAIVVVDYKGNPLTKHSGCHKFCEIVRGNSNLAKHCKKCDSRGGLEAVRLNKPYIYLCHYNIVDVAIPIIINEQYIGAIMAGQVKLSNADDFDNLEQILNIGNRSNEVEELSDELKKYYDDLPILSYEQVSDISNMLFYLAKYIIEEALDKNLILDMCERVVSDERSKSKEVFDGYGLNNIRNIQKEMSNAIINSCITEINNKENKEFLVSKTLKPAIEYIHNNKSENLSMEKMAQLCHVSTSYFSRLFSKELGENFSTYISKLKIKWAKNLLKETDMHINEISEELGFSEAGYFIKIFKKYEGVTPSLYRKHYKDKIK